MDFAKLPARWLRGALALSIISTGCLASAQFSFPQTPLIGNTDVRKAIDASGNLTVAAALDDSDFGHLVVRHYDAAGNTVWTNTGTTATINAMATDSGGSTILVGKRLASGRQDDVFIRKIDSLGNTLWTRLYNVGPNSDDAGYGIVIDGSDNIVISGVAYATLNPRFLTMKFDPNGNVMWHRITSPAVFGYGQFIQLDASGNTYVVGSVLIDTVFFVEVIKYDPSGTCLWTRRKQILNGSIIAVDALYLSNTQQLAVLTNLTDVAGGESALLLFASDNASDPKIVKYQGVGDLNMRGLASGNGAIMAVGSMTPSGGSETPFMLTYNETTLALTAKRTWKNGPTASHSGYCQAAIFDGSDFLVATNFSGDGDTFDPFVLTLATNGNLLLSTRLGITGIDDYSHGMANDSANGAYLVGLDANHLVKIFHYTT